MEPEQVKQRSQDWIELRRGKFTASEIHKLMGKSFGETLDKWTGTAQTYIMEKVAESFSTESQPLSSIEIRWGNENEPFGKAHYELIFGEEIEDIGFVLWSKNKECGCSPDGFVKGKNRGMELKCPYTLKSHIESFFINTNEQFKASKTNYYWQVMSSMMFTGYREWDFVSFHPYFKPEQRLSCIEIIADDKEFTFLAERLQAAVITRDKLIEQINQ